MTAQLAPIPAATFHHPTVWGLTPTQIHDRYWAARGVQVVRQGERSEIVGGAELFLLTDARTLALFKLHRAVETLSWIKPDVLFVRLRDDREHGYREHVVTGPQNRFIRFERVYGGLDSRQGRVALTPERRLAQLWQNAPDLREAWRLLRIETSRLGRNVLSVPGRVYDRFDDQEVMQFTRELVLAWKHPDSTIGRARHAGDSVIADPTARIGNKRACAGPIWIGAGRSIDGSASIAGPAILWDAPEARPEVEDLEWQEIEPTPSLERPIRLRRHRRLARAGKRLFDIAFALVALLLTLPLYPFILLAIWLEDGRPFFFVHTRESVGGREFGCIKFRTMRKDAEQLKEQLASQNLSDGNHFHIPDDPRISRVGSFLRATNLDELPQFLNVLRGDMSVVGPRPSPRKENQCCPAWREARLSVRPGITGLWQVRRTRQQGHDFQEWIRYDIEYVENASWVLDLRIILATIRMLIRGIVRA